MSEKGKNFKSGPMVDERVINQAIRLITNGETLESAQLPEELGVRVRRLLAHVACINEPSDVNAFGLSSIEAGDRLLSTLKSRFDAHPERHEGVDWAEVEKALIAHPEKLASLKKLEETGGEPDVIAIEGGDIVFGECSKKSPGRREFLNYDQAVQTAEAIGVELMDEATYQKIQRFGKFDFETPSWLKTPADIRKTGKALMGERCRGRGETAVIQMDANWRNSEVGWRGVLRVPKA